MKTDSIQLFTVKKLGGLGDGVVTVNGKSVHLPLIMPGDVVKMRCDGKRPIFIEISEPSSDREAPQCSHFGKCGGCQLQHLPQTIYQQLKRQRLATALSRAGYQFASEAIDYYAVPSYSRRRAHFAITANQTGVQLGFYQRKSQHLVPLHDCAVLAPKLLTLMHDFATMAGKLAGRYQMQQLHIHKTAQGVDLQLTLSNQISLSDRKTLITWAKANEVARFTLLCDQQYIELICAHQPAVTRGNYEIDLPNGAFLQATEEAETWIQETIMRIIPSPPAKIIDLYAGLATYSGHLASQGYDIVGYEGSERMVNAVRTAKTDAAPLCFYTRDLFRQPVTEPELKQADVVLINPPRNGAEPQYRALAESAVQTIIVISCDVSSLERDVAWLHKAGYQLSYAGLIDQFLWTTHIESVLLFSKLPA